MSSHIYQIRCVVFSAKSLAILSSSARINLLAGNVAVKAMMAATAHLRLFAVLTARAINAPSKSCLVWIQEKEVQRVKTEKSLSYGDARKLVKSSSSSSSSVAPSYASAAKTSPKKVSMECQTFSFWIGPQPSLREASRLPSVQTANAGSGTHDTTSSSSHQTKTNVRNESPAKSDTWSQQKTRNNNNTKLQTN